MAALAWRAVLDRRKQEWVDASGDARLIKIRQSWRGPGAHALGVSGIQPGPTLASLGAGLAARPLCLSGESDIELTEECVTSLLSSSLRLELVAMPRGFDPTLGPNGGLSADAMLPDQLELLGRADFPLMNIVQAPQPEFVLISALLDDAGGPAGEALFEVQLTPDDDLLVCACALKCFDPRNPISTDFMYFAYNSPSPARARALRQDYLVGGVVFQAEAIDLTMPPAFWVPPLPDLRKAQAKYDAAVSAALTALEGAETAAAAAATNLASARAEVAAAANGAGGDGGAGRAAKALSKAEDAMEAARVVADVARKAASNPASLALFVGEAVQAAAVAGGKVKLVPPGLVDVSTAFGAQSLVPAPPVFKFCTLNGFDLAACLEVLDDEESAGGALVPEEEASQDVDEIADAGAEAEADGSEEPQVQAAPPAKRSDKKIKILPPPTAEAEAAASAAVSGRCGWRIRWGASSLIWLASGSQKRLKAAAATSGFDFFSSSPVAEDIDAVARGGLESHRADLSLRFELSGAAQDSALEQATAVSSDLVTVEVPMATVFKGESGKSPPDDSAGSRPGTSMSSRSCAASTVVPGVGSESGSGLTLYRSRFALPAFVPLSPQRESGPDSAEVGGGSSDGAGEDGQAKAHRRPGTALARPLLTVSLCASRPLVLPPPPPPPLARSRAPKARRGRQGDKGPSPAEALAALPPLVRLGATRRLPWAVLPAPLPPQRATADPAPVSGIAVSAVVASPSNASGPSALGLSPAEQQQAPVNWWRANAWSSADPLVAALLPFRPIESPSAQLMKRNPVDDLERDLNDFVNTLADEIRVEFRLDDRVWQNEGPDGAKARERRENERRRLSNARAMAGLDPKVVARAAAAQSRARAASEQTVPGTRARGKAAAPGPCDTDENDLRDDPVQNDTEGAAMLIYKLNASGKYHQIAEAIRKPVAHFVHFKMGRSMADGDRSTSSGDRYVCEAYGLVADLMTRTLNKLFRGAELFEDQPAARQEAADALAKLTAHLDRLEALAMDAESGGRLRVAEVRLRVRVKLVEAAADHSSPPLMPTEEERQAGVAVEAESGSLLLGNLAAPALVRCRLDLAGFLLRNRLRAPAASLPTAPSADCDRGRLSGASPDDGSGLTLGACAASVPGVAASAPKLQVAPAMAPCHPLGVPGLGLGDAAYGGHDGSADLEAVRAGLDGLSASLAELRAVGAVVVGSDGNGLPLRLRQEVLVLFGAALLEHEIAACPILATWADECGGKPWSQLSTFIPPFDLPGELGDTYGEGTRLQPRRWSVSILEHAVRVALAPDLDARAPPEGFGHEEVLACRACPSALLAVLAVALVATDSRRRAGYGDGAYGFGAEEPAGGHANGAMRAESAAARSARATSTDPLAYSFGHEARARALIRLSAEKRRREFSGEKKRIDEDDETIVLLQASEWLADNKLLAGAQVALCLAKAASNRAQRAVGRALATPSMVGISPSLINLTPRSLRVMAKVAVAKLGLARVPVPNADVLDFRGDRGHLHHHHFEVLAPDGPLTFARPTTLSHAALLAIAADRIEDASALFRSTASAPIELLLLAGDHAWAGRMQASKSAAEVDENRGGKVVTAVLKATAEVQRAYGAFIECARAQGQPAPLRAFTRLGSAAAELGNLDDAVDIYRQGCKAWCNAASVWKGLGLCLLQQQRFDEAEVALDLSNERDNSDALTWGCLALCNLRAMLREGSTGNQYRMGAVAASINEALLLRLDDVTLLFDLARCYAMCDRYVDSARLLRLAIDLRHYADARAANGVPGAKAAAAVLPSAEVMRNCLADSLKSVGNDLDALDEYQAVFERCVFVVESELGAAAAEADEGAAVFSAQLGAKSEAAEVHAESEGSAFGGRSTPPNGAETGVPLVPSLALLSSIKELHRAAAGIESLLTKLGRGSELKQLKYTVKIIDARLRLVTDLAAK